MNKDILAEQKILGAEIFDGVAEFGGFFGLELFDGFAHVGFKVGYVGFEVGLGGGFEGFGGGVIAGSVEVVGFGDGS